MTFPTGDEDRRPGPLYRRHMTVIGYHAQLAHDHRDCAGAGLRSVLTAVASPTARSITMQYQPKSICHSFHPKRAHDGFK